MPRGEETQLPPQEGEGASREVKAQDEIKEGEARRDQEVVAEPQAVIERERPVQESEEIEKEMIETVEATDRTAAEGGDEISATPIPLPVDPPGEIGDEVSATPITLPKEDPDGIKTGRDEISATPITLPGQALEDPDLVQPDAPPAPVKDDEPQPPPHRQMAMEEEPTPETIDREIDRDLPEVDQAVDEYIDPSAQEQHAGAPSQPLVEKELPEGGQMEEGFEQQEDLQDLADGDFGSLMPEGKLTGPDGKESKDSKFGEGLGGIPGMDSGGKIDGSSEDPSGDQFAGKGTFKPGKGPGGGETEGGGPGKDYTYTEDEVNVMELITGGASKEQIAAKERQLQEKALDEFQLIYTSPTDTPPGEQKTDKEDPPKPKPKTSSESTPEEGGGSDVHAVSQEEFDAVIDKVGGGQISNQDPDDQSGGEPDGRLKPEAAKKIKDAMDQAASTKHKQKKAGAELITDPDQEDPEGGDLGRKLDVDKDI